MRRQSEATHFIHRVACASIRVDSTVIYRNTGSPGCQQVRVRCGVWDSETYHCQRSPCQVKVIDSTKWPIRSHRFMHHKLIYASYSTYIIRWNNKIVFPLLFKKFWLNTRKICEETRFSLWALWLFIKDNACFRPHVYSIYCSYMSF